MTELWLVPFAIATGFTASGIVACIYRMMGIRAESRGGQVARAAVMIVAGPILLCETAINAFRDKKWQPVWLWVTVAGIAYWSLALGLLVLDVAIHWPQA